MHVVTELDRLDDFADIDAILDDGVARLEVFERDLVPQRDVHRRLGLDRLVGIERTTLEGLTGLDIDDGYTDRITLVVHQELNHSHISFRKFKIADLRFQITHHAAIRLNALCGRNASAAATLACAPRVRHCRSISSASGAKS